MWWCVIGVDLWFVCFDGGVVWELVVDVGIDWLIWELIEWYEWNVFFVRGVGVGVVDVVERVVVVCDWLDDYVVYVIEWMCG